LSCAGGTRPASDSGQFEVRVTNVDMVVLHEVGVMLRGTYYDLGDIEPGQSTHTLAQQPATGEFYLSCPDYEAGNGRFDLELVVAAAVSAGVPPLRLVHVTLSRQKADPSYRFATGDERGER
jgi:hypothetical protein